MGVLQPLQCSMGRNKRQFHSVQLAPWVLVPEEQWGICKAVSLLTPSATACGVERVEAAAEEVRDGRRDTKACRSGAAP